MHRAFSFPMTAERCRNKERLEASLAGLCELELLKQRQECLVLGALSLGDTDPGHPAWGDLQPPLSAPTGPSRVQEDLTLRRQLNSLQSPPWGLMAALAQLVGDLRVDLEPGGAQPQGDPAESRSSSGFYELSAGQPLVTVSDPSVFGDLSSSSLGEGRVPCVGERPKSISDIFMARRDGLLEPCPRPAVPRSFSAPYASLEGIAEGVGEEDPCAWGSEYLSPGLEESPTAEDFQEALRVEGYILGLIQRRVLPTRPSKPRTTLGPESRGVARQSSLRRKEGPESRNASPGLPGLDSPSWAFQGLEEERGGGAEDCLPPRYPLPRPAALDYPCRGAEPSSSEPDSPQRSADSPRTPSPGDQLVSAHYIPAQPCRAAPCRAPPAHLLRPAHRPPAPAKPQRTPYSPERAPPASRSRAPPRKCRGGEADSPGPRKAGRRAGRSQSENSLLGQRAGERKYSTVERDAGRGCQARPRRPQPGSLGYRRWRSTQELSQDEGEPAGEQASRRPRKPRPPPPPYPYPYAPHPHYRHGDGGEAPPCRPEEAYGAPPAGESESSLSEADSRGSSSLSTDSDESGGLVWPQQLPPQLNAAASPPNPPGGPAQPKAFVKIKASHALKKKILRFRTGSLKVMTTV
ncbi:LOW QUALITY PROTEIN: dapper homolog 3-like [Conger conger]|uniref:LOW QUALITY PROTEIN: dapper homolog 3-like n=1 Tax=Conger conger TaxID=82655 RepID=UPI002A599421|nr:LOW QUALITY PROTEIN: dapper homolog 3-like [Conger conger]